jgi:hypothetical protein
MAKSRTCRPLVLCGSIARRGCEPAYGAETAPSMIPVISGWATLADDDGSLGSIVVVVDWGGWGRRWKEWTGPTSFGGQARAKARAKHVRLIS